MIILLVTKLLQKGELIKYCVGQIDPFFPGNVVDYIVAGRHEDENTDEVNTVFTVRTKGEAGNLTHQIKKEDVFDEIWE